MAISERDNQNKAVEIEWDWNMLPKVLKEYGQNTSIINQLSPKMIGTALIGIACASLGRNAFLTPNTKNPTWKERPNMWGICTAPAGSRKSAVLKKAIAPVFREQKELHKQWIDDMEEWKREEVQFKSKKSFFDKQLKIMLEMKKDTDTLTAPSIRQKPKKKHYIATDITMERIPSFIEEADGSALVAFDEMSAFFQSVSGGSSRNTGSEARSLYLSAWDGDSFDARLRQDKDKETDTEGASISIFGMAQPDVMADYVKNYKKIKDGLLARFQLITYQEDYIRYEDSDIHHDQRAQDLYGAFIGKLLRFKRKNAFYFDNAAQIEFKNWLNHNENLQIKYNERRDILMGEIISKRVKAVCGLAMIIHFAEEMEHTDEPVGGISINTLKKALMLNDFYIAEAKKVVGSEERKEIEEEELALRVIEWLKEPIHQTKIKDGATGTEISTALRKKGIRPPANEILDIAKSAGYRITARRIYPLSR